MGPPGSTAGGTWREGRRGTGYSGGGAGGSRAWEGGREEPAIAGSEWSESSEAVMTAGEGIRA